MTDTSARRDRARSVVPAVPAGTVPRTRLDERFARATGQVLRVLAPAGYGKSTLVARWAADDGRAVVWLDVERLDNDPVVLIDALVRGLDPVLDAPITAEGDVDGDDGARRGPVGTTTVEGLRSAVQEARPFVLVLDDVHLLDAPAALGVVRAVATSVPPESTVVLVGRAHHDDEVAPVRLSPGIVDLTAEHLALDLAETEALLAAGGVPVDVDDLTLLDEQFEGWPAGIRLATLVLGAPVGNRSPTPLADAGGITFVTDYLRAEWLGNLHPSDRRFLMEAACLGRFTARMCDVVLDRRRSSDTIRRLDRDRLIVLPLDRRGDWYRMHALLGRWLATELRDTDHARWREVHLDAARWWEQEGDVDLALEHLDLAGEVDRYEELVVTHTPGHISLGRSATVRRWLSTLPSGRVRRSPGLCAAEAVQALAAGDGARALRWSRLLGSPPPPPVPPTAPAPRSPPWLGWAELIRASLEVRPAAEMVPLALHARDTVGTGPWRAYACLTAGGLLALTGDDRAVDVLRDGADEGAAGNAPTQAANCLALTAVLADLDGDVDRAMALGEEAIQLVDGMRFDHIAPVAGTVVAMRALGHARDGRQAPATADIVRARAILAGFAEVAPWYNVFVRLPLVRSSLLLDDPATAWELLREADDHLCLEPVGGRIAGHAEALRAQVEAARRLADDRTWSLTTAELRVMRYLPTNLSLADIAGRLYVSRNTVKSHTSSIYRKLGTTSRSDAVDLARAAGLLDLDDA